MVTSVAFKDCFSDGKEICEEGSIVVYMSKYDLTNCDSSEIRIGHPLDTNEQICRKNVQGKLALEQKTTLLSTRKYWQGNFLSLVLMGERDLIRINHQNN